MENGQEPDGDGNDLTEFLASIKVDANQIVYAVKQPDMDYIFTTIDIARAGGASKPMVDHIREMQLIKAYFNAD